MVRTALNALDGIAALGGVAVSKSPAACEWAIRFNDPGDVAQQISIDAANLTFGSGSSVVVEGTAVLSELQRVYHEATGGTFRLGFGTEWTGDLYWNAGALAVETALNGLAGVQLDSIFIERIVGIVQTVSLRVDDNNLPAAVVVFIGCDLFDGGFVQHNRVQRSAQIVINAS